MLRLSTILQLQTVWETIPNQPSRPCSRASLSGASSVRTKPASLLEVATENLASIEEQEQQQPEEDPIKPLSPEPSPLPASSLPAPLVSPPASVHTSSTSSDESAIECSSPAISVALTVPTIEITHSVQQQRSQSLPTKNTPPLSPEAPPLPPMKYPPPPPVPSKDPQINNNTTNKKADDNADTKRNITKKPSRYGFLRSAASPPPSIHSSTVAPVSTMMTDANQALRRESSKISLRRKSLSKKLKKAISTIKLNADTH
ncbi:hypothetical protein BC941DRAFT_413890 [Chlamydoabsidia padenii]|nr:hypothetical protein BC941DRAFT_413890 [Chlamydoabsidia padenii]